MDITKYEVLLKVVDDGSFSSAAEELGYTPSGMNRLIGSIEQDLGFAIFHRTKKGVRLTNDGERILPTVKRIVSLERQLREDADDICGLETGNINIGTIYSVASMLLPDAIREFKKMYPGITVQVIQGSHQELNQWFDEGKVDLLFTSKRSHEENWITIKKDPMVVWINKNHPLADLEAFPEKSLFSEPLILTMPGQDTDSEKYLNDRNIKPNIQYSSRDSFASYRMVEAELGVSLNNLMMAQNWDGDVVVLPLDPPAHIELGIRYPEQCSLSAKKFCELARNMFA